MMPSVSENELFAFAGRSCRDTARLTCGGNCGGSCSPSSGINGILTYGPGDYHGEKDCWWLIAAHVPGDTISVSFSSLHTASVMDDAGLPHFVALYACESEESCARAQSDEFALPSGSGSASGDGFACGSGAGSGSSMSEDEYIAVDTYLESEEADGYWDVLDQSFMCVVTLFPDFM